MFDIMLRTEFDDVSLQNIERFVLFWGIFYSVGFRLFVLALKRSTPQTTDIDQFTTNIADKISASLNTLQE